MTKAWQCGWCDKTTVERRRWCILWGPASRERVKARYAYDRAMVALTEARNACS